MKVSQHGVKYPLQNEHKQVINSTHDLKSSEDICRAIINGGELYSKIK